MSSPYLQEFEELWFALRPHRPIAFGTHLARITGHPKDAMLLSQLIYWTRRGRDVGENGGWIHKTREHWFIETGLSREEQENARRRLRELNLVAEWRGGRQACMHYRVEVAAISTAVRANCRLVGRLPWSIEAIRTDEYAMSELLGPTVAYRRVFVDLVGNVNAALLLSRMVQLQRREADRQCTWFTLTGTEWQRTLGLNRRQLESARNRLRHQGLIRELTRFRTGKRVFTQVNAVALHAQLERLVSRLAARDVLATRRSLIAAHDNRPAPGASQKPVTLGNRPVCNLSVRIGRPVTFSDSPTETRQLPDQLSGLLPSATLVHYRWRETCIPNARAYTRITYSTTTTTGYACLLDHSPVVVVRIRADCESPRSSSVFVPPDGGLIWPAMLRANERELIAARLCRVRHVERQVLLDEMAASHRHQPVRLPVAYMGGLVRRYLAGEFVPAKAHLERAARCGPAACAAEAIVGDGSDAENPRSPSTRDVAHQHLAAIRERLRGQFAYSGSCHG